MPEAKPSGKPDAGNPHVRFDEGEGLTLPTLPIEKETPKDLNHTNAGGRWCQYFDFGVAKNGLKPLDAAPIAWYIFSN